LKKFCLLVIKFFSDKNSGIINQKSLIKALKYASYKNIYYLNLSGGGESYNKEEEELLHTILSNNVTVVVAAGNKARNLSSDCRYFPACYKFNNERFYVIANRSPISNYNGPVSIIEEGNNVEGGGIVLSGSSQACAIATGKLAGGWYENIISN
jgi:hypothetical protein